MRNQHCALALALVIVVAAALAAIFHQSRTFTQIMGQDYDPERIDHVQVFLSAMDHDTPPGRCSSPRRIRRPRRCWTF